jgi:predicted cobalt transporter CbtA
VLTATTTAAGLACIAFSRRLALRLLGVVVIVMPHIAGAPQVSEIHHGVPEQMAQAFVAGSLAISATMWVILGAATAALMKALAHSTAR